MGLTVWISYSNPLENLRLLVEFLAQVPGFWSCLLFVVLLKDVVFVKKNCHKVMPQWIETLLPQRGIEPQSLAI